MISIEDQNDVFSSSVASPDHTVSASKKSIQGASEWISIAKPSRVGRNSATSSFSFDGNNSEKSSRVKVIGDDKDFNK